MKAADIKAVLEMKLAYLSGNVSHGSLSCCSSHLKCCEYHCGKT